MFVKQILANYIYIYLLTNQENMVKQGLLILANK